MKRLDRAAIGRVRKETAIELQLQTEVVRNRHPQGWNDTWRRVRLRCSECDAGYLQPHNRGYARPQCVECDRYPLQRAAWWEEKAKIALHLVAGEDHGQLWPYFLVDLR